MLKHDGQWVALSDRERLVMLAIAFELAQVKCLEVMAGDVRAASGLPGSDFTETLRGLETKDLVSVENDQWPMVGFAGDAVTTALVGRYKMWLVRRGKGILLR